MHASELQRIQTLLSAGVDAGEHIHLLQVSYRTVMTLTNIEPFRTDSNWTWSAQNQALWTQTDTLYQDFYDKWRGSEPALYNPIDTNIVPYVLNVGGPTTKDGDATILVTASFVEMLQRILLLRSDVLNQRIDAQGVVITGQPGIGKLYLPSSLSTSIQFVPATHKFADMCVGL